MGGKWSVISHNIRLAFIVVVTEILRDETMVDKLMYFAHDDSQNHPFCRLQLVIETFGNSTSEPTNKVPKAYK